MKNLFFSLCAIALLSLSSCDKYDDGPLSNRVDNLENRVKSLEEQCKQLNANVSSIQTLVDALKDHDVITSVTPLVEGDKEVGYSFAFSKSPSISVYHGKDGQSGQDGQNGIAGNTPVIGTKQDSDGRYYWTLNGEWLLDDKKEKTPCDGLSDGVAPKFQIKDSNWHLSLDGGDTWVNLGKGTANGQSTNIVFKDIDISKPDKVTFTLSDGTKFELPRQAELTISFDKNELSEVNPNTTYTIGYVVEGKTAGLKLEILSSGNVRAKLNNRNSAKGTITIITGETIDEYDKVIMLASNGNTTVMSSITFSEGDYLQVTSGATYQVSSDGGALNVNIETNTEYSISIPEEAKSWISIMESRAIRQETVTLSISKNEDVERTANVQIVDKTGNVFTSIEINQDRGSNNNTITIPSDMKIAFPDPNFRSYVLSEFDRNNDGVISNEEALNATIISVSNKNIISLEGIQYFVNLEKLNCRDNKLTRLDLSNNISLTSLNCVSNELTTLDLSKNIALTSLECDGNQFTTLDLSKNSALTRLWCGANLQLESLDLSNCSALTLLNCTHNHQLMSLNLSNCTALTKLICNYNHQLKFLDLCDCIALDEIECRDTPLATLDLSNNTLLTKLMLYSTELTTLDLSKNTELIDLNCSCNSLTLLNLSNCMSLKELHCRDNHLKTLDLSGCIALTKLSCENNQLETLYLSGCIALTMLYCSNNQVETLDLSDCIALTELTCNRNKLISLDLSNNTRLQRITCSSNNLITLDLSKNTALTYLTCDMETLQTLYLKTGCHLYGITSGRESGYINPNTEIKYID